MNMITRCPACATVFRVAPEQLQAAGGWLRCGHCEHAFDSTGLVLFWEPLAEPDRTHVPIDRPVIAPNATFVGSEAVATDDLLTVEGPNALQVSPPSHDGLASFEDALSSFRQPLSLPSDLASTVLRAESSQVAVELSVAHRTNKADPSKFWRLALILLVLLLILQAAFVQRHLLALHWPAAVSGLDTLCQSVGCTIDASEHVEALVIESSTLVRRTDDFLLSWTLRNTSSNTLAMTALELTLLSGNHQPVFRKVVLPNEMGAPKALQAGQTWAGQLSLRIANETPFSDYRILSFYP
jgi:predicted Zn finger-like uncharacterized protein